MIRNRCTPDSIDAYNGFVRSAQARLRDLPRPVIAAIRGASFGGGCGLALTCVLQVADGTAAFAITPARLGLAYSPADTWKLIEKVGVARAKDLLLTGRRVAPRVALSIGLIDRLSDTDAVAAAQTLAAELAVLAPGVLAAIKAITNGLSEPVFLPEQSVFERTFTAPEFREGYSAFLEKCTPDF